MMTVIDECDVHGEVEFVKGSIRIFKEAWECTECKKEQEKGNNIAAFIKLPFQMNKITKYHIMNQE